jgi:hypothetical protein
MTSTYLRRAFILWVLCVLPAILCSCLGPRRAPRYPKDICEIFRENRGWYRDAYASHKRWGIPIPVMMAIMYQESKFEAKARPPRTTCLRIFPGPRPSSAYGYSQALNATWQKYKRSTGNRGADRDDFDDAIDFIGWYCHVSYIQCKIEKDDAYNLYIAYHEGQGGFLRKSHHKQAWLGRVAAEVSRRARLYKRQLASCEREFQRGRGCCFWPF